MRNATTRARFIWVVARGYAGFLLTVMVRALPLSTCASALRKNRLAGGVAPWREKEVNRDNYIRSCPTSLRNPGEAERALSRPVDLFALETDVDFDGQAGEAIIDLSDSSNERRLRRVRATIFAFCALVAVLDGFDVQVIGIAAPAMARAIHIPVHLFGTVFSTSFLGLALGAALIGMLSDRIGRKPVLTIVTAAFGLCSIATASVSSLDGLLVVRFLAGVALGGAMPTFIGMVSDYAPQQKRGGLVTLLWTGFPVGGMLAGIVSPHAIDMFGWRSVFYIGGVLPVVLAVIIALAIPESPGVLLRRGARTTKVGRTSKRVWPERQPVSRTLILPGGASPSENSIKLLFTDGRGRASVLFFASFFTTFLLLITCAVWTPALLQTRGMSLVSAGAALIALNLGSIVGTPLARVLIGPRSPKRGLGLTFLFCAAALVLVGRETTSVGTIALLMTAIGFLLGAGSSALIALVAQVYPAAVRSTALGSAMSIGRLGSVTGPLIVGILVTWNWSTGAIFAALAVPALIAALCTLLLRSAGDE